MIQNLENTTSRDANFSNTSNPTQPEDEKIAEEEENINNAKEVGSSSDNPQKPSTDPTEAPNDQISTEPSLKTPKVGNPVSHGQVIDLWKQLKASKLSPCSLDLLLRGARVYIPPPPPKPEPVSIARQPLPSTDFSPTQLTLTFPDIGIQSAHGTSSSRGGAPSLRTHDKPSPANGNICPKISRLLRSTCLFLKFQYSR